MEGTTKQGREAGREKGFGLTTEPSGISSSYHLGDGALITGFGSSDVRGQVEPHTLGFARPSLSSSIRELPTDIPRALYTMKVSHLCSLAIPSTQDSQDGWFVTCDQTQLLGLSVRHTLQNMTQRQDLMGASSMCMRVECSSYLCVSESWSEHNDSSSLAARFYSCSVRADNWGEECVCSSWSPESRAANVPSIPVSPNLHLHAGPSKHVLS